MASHFPPMSSHLVIHTSVLQAGPVMVPIVAEMAARAAMSSSSSSSYNITGGGGGGGGGGGMNQNMAGGSYAEHLLAGSQVWGDAVMDTLSHVRCLIMNRGMISLIDHCRIVQVT